MSECIISRILKHSMGYGFKITFETVEDAEKCKDMLYWILKNENKMKVNIKYNRSERNNNVE